MVDVNVLRNATSDEKKEYIEIGKSKTVEQEFVKELHKYENLATKNHIPFCRKAAYDDFEDKKDRILKEAERKSTNGELVISPNDFKMDWAKYSDIRNFELLDESEVIEDKLLDGMRQSVTTGIWKNYQYKGKKYRISVFVPKDFLEKAKSKTPVGTTSDSVK